MNPTRLKILLGVAFVLLAMVLWNWISGWGLVTVHVTNEPLAKVIKSIERQGGVKVVTNADLNTTINMDVDRVSAVSAVDTVAAWLDGSSTLGYAAGATKADVLGGVAALQAGDRDANFARFGFRSGGGGGDFGGMEPGNSVVDVREVSWKVSPSDDPKLQSYLSQLSMKTGVGIVVPTEWNPPLAKVPDGGSTDKAIRALVGSAKGQVQEIFVIRVQDDNPPPQTASNDGGRDRRSEGGFGGRQNFNPEWIQERMEARIAQLPKDEQEGAKKDFDDMRDMWGKMRALPEDQRREAMDKMANDPAFQDKMVERMMSRDAKRSPEKRADRFRKYIARKQQITQGGAPAPQAPGGR